jgi:hypothetical protein
MAQLGDLYNHAGHQPGKAEALADILIKRHPGYPNGYIVRACNLMDRNLPDVYDTLTALSITSAMIDNGKHRRPRCMLT